MRIAILGFGSLIRNSNGLSLASEWEATDLELPLEFSRVSSSGNREGCLTLVIDQENGSDCQVYAAELNLTNLNHAIGEFAARERVTLIKSIGWVNLQARTCNDWALKWYPETCDRIINWAAAHGYDAVVWANFRANFEKLTEIPFSVDEAVAYLQALPEETKTLALEYINDAPETIQTPLRRRLAGDNAARQRAASRRRGVARRR